MRAIAVFVMMTLFAAPAMAQATTAPAPAAESAIADKVVYHIDDAREQALKGLRNMRNQMETAPNTKMIVVAHGDGVDFLFDGARDPKTNEAYAPLIAGLKAMGVTFEVCEITMKRRNLTKDNFAMEADYTPFRRGADHRSFSIGITTPISNPDDRPTDRSRRRPQRARYWRRC